MRPFDYYSENPHPFPSIADYKKQLRQKIDETPMTAAEREQEIAEIPEKANAWLKEAARPHREHAAKRKEAFWKDCRQTIGYCSFLNEEGVQILESKADEHGHSAGFSEVYNYLCEFSDFAKVMIRCRKQGDLK